MKEATGETSMTMITIAAIAVIAGILVILWPRIQGWIEEEFDSVRGTQNNVVCPNGANPDGTCK